MHTVVATHLRAEFVHVFPECHSMSHAEEGSASGDYLSPWELDERRGGLIAASCGGFECQRRE